MILRLAPLDLLKFYFRTIEIKVLKVGIVCKCLVIESWWLIRKQKKSSKGHINY